MGQASRRKWQNRFIRRAVTLIKSGAIESDAYTRAWQELQEHKRQLTAHREVLRLAAAFGEEFARAAAKRLRVFKSGGMHAP